MALFNLTKRLILIINNKSLILTILIFQWAHIQKKTKIIKNYDFYEFMYYFDININDQSLNLLLVIQIHSIRY